MREKVIDVSCRLAQSALALQMHGAGGDTLAAGIENRDPISVVAQVVKYKLVSVMAMCAGCHNCISQGEFGLKSKAKQCLDGS